MTNISINLNEGAACATGPVPIVSVYMPTYNRIGLLRRAIRSVLLQDMQSFELIIVDDGSCDGTEAYVSGIAAADHRVKYLRNETNLGACASRNRAINVARGYFITGLDDDDFFLPSRLSSFLARWAVAEKIEPSLRGLYSNIYFMIFSDGGGRATSVIERVTQLDLQRRNYVNNNVFTRTEYLREIGGFDPHFPAWQDYDTWYRLVGKEGCLLSESSVSYVLDSSHGGERISANSLRRFEVAYSLFCIKHELTSYVAATLRNNLFEHPLSRMTLIDLLRQAWYGDPSVAIRVFLLKNLSLAWREYMHPRPVATELMSAIRSQLLSVEA